MTPVAMTIAGSDPSGGAGLQADLKTFHQHRVYGTSVVSLLTVQNTETVDQVRVLEPDFVLAQLDALLTGMPPAAAKTGALGSAEVVQAIARRAALLRQPQYVSADVAYRSAVASRIESTAMARERKNLRRHFGYAVFLPPLIRQKTDHGVAATGLRATVKTQDSRGIPGLCSWSSPNSPCVPSADLCCETASWRMYHVAEWPDKSN